MASAAGDRAQRVQEMYALYQQGATLDEVGKEFGLTGERVGQLLRKAGLRTRSRSETQALERRERVREMYELYEQGASLEAVGREFGLSRSGVAHLFHQESKRLRSAAQTAAQRRQHDPRPREMHELYRQGATVAEIASDFGVSPSRVRQLFAQAGLAARGPAEYPVQEMYELYELGASLAEVGREFGLRAQLVLDVFKRAGLSTRSLSQTRTLKLHMDEGRSDEIVDAFRELSDPRAVAEELEIPLTLVRRILRQQITTGEYKALLLKGKRPRRFSDEQLLGFLRQAGSRLDGPLSAAAYRRIADGQRTGEGHRWPTPETFVRRFGGWRKAVLAAGLQANEPLAIAHARRFSSEDCLNAIRAAHRRLGRVPSAAEYAAYARASKRPRPSLGLVLRRCGSWTEALRTAGL